MFTCMTFHNIILLLQKAWKPSANMMGTFNSKLFRSDGDTPVRGGMQSVKNDVVLCNHEKTNADITRQSCAMSDIQGAEMVIQHNNPSM